MIWAAVIATVFGLVGLALFLYNMELQSRNEGRYRPWWYWGIRGVPWLLYYGLWHALMHWMSWYEAAGLAMTVSLPVFWWAEKWTRQRFEMSRDNDGLKARPWNERGGSG